ncbi:unnamed protein product [Peniophora sp. CBMAI 1063]|nr:unnamed protein product [Peniophora sp. CBMAI 1063]
MSISDALFRLEANNHIAATLKEYQTQPRIRESLLSLMRFCIEPSSDLRNIVKAADALSGGKPALIDNLKKSLPPSYRISLNLDHRVASVTVGTPIDTATDTGVQASGSPCATCADKRWKRWKGPYHFRMFRKEVDKCYPTSCGSVLLKMLDIIVTRHCQRRGLDRASVNVVSISDEEKVVIMGEVLDELDALFHGHPKMKHCLRTVIRNARGSEPPVAPAPAWNMNLKTLVF